MPQTPLANFWRPIYLKLGVCIEDGYPYRVLSSFYDSILKHLSSSLSPSRPAPKFDLRWSLIWYIKTPCLFTNPSLTWTVSLYHTYGMICLLITTKTLFYWENANENGFLHIFSTGNLLNFARFDKLAPAQKSRKAQFTCQHKFSSIFTTKDVDFMHF